MKIIGVHILEDTAEEVRKNLTEEWYPFVQSYETPVTNREEYLRYRKADQTLSEVYHTNGNLPKFLNVCCVVGKNGSGKSTLFELVYRIVNNLACKLFERGDSDVDSWLSYAYGVHAELFFELPNRNGDCQLGLLRCEGDEVTFCLGFNETGDFLRHPLTKRSEVLRNFFYTISINYSIYSLNNKDFDPYNPFHAYDRTINGDWLHGMFHKNDGYQAPITLAPFRKDGKIDIAKEQRLAHQRLSVLWILLYSQRKTFIPGYHPYRLDYAFNLEYKTQADKSLKEQLKEQFTPKQIDRCVQAFATVWEKKFGWLIELTAPKGSPAYEVIVYYLAAKSFRICHTYAKFRKRFNARELVGDCEHGDKEPPTSNSTLVNKATRAVNKILSPQEDSHITLKINQCVNYIKRRSYGTGNGHVMCKQAFRGSRFKTYDDVMKELPPSFYETQLVLRRSYTAQPGVTQQQARDITLNHMSSGELQMLYSISYIIYHIKNLESVKTTDGMMMYNHVNIIMDEVELYMHPEYQRRFLTFLLDRIGDCHINRTKIWSVNILFATHSPFILSDIQQGSILYLEDGKRRKVEMETFGANLYNLMGSSFFFTENAMGCIASKVIGDTIRKANEKGEVDERVLGIIGDGYVRDYLRHFSGEEAADVQDS